MSESVLNAPTQHGKLYRFLNVLMYPIAHHPHIHVGANALSSMQGIIFGTWIYVVFVVRRDAPSGYFLAWILPLYVLIELTSSALMIRIWDRWVAMLVDFGTALVLVGLMIYIWSNHIVFEISNDRWTAALIVTFVTISCFFASILIAMIVNTRVIGPAPIGISPQR